MHSSLIRKVAALPATYHSIIITTYSLTIVGAPRVTCEASIDMHKTPCRWDGCVFLQRPASSVIRL